MTLFEILNKPAAQVQRDYDFEAELTAWREAVTNPTADRNAPREDLKGMTALEAALFGAAGADCGDGAYAYANAEGREDLATLLEGETELGAALTSGRHGKERISILAQALTYQAEGAVEILVGAGAQLAEGEEPVRILMSEGSVEAQMFGHHDSPVAVGACLKALKSAGVDINAAIDDKPAAFHVAETLIEPMLTFQDDITVNPYTLGRSCMKEADEAGLDFQARDGAGRGIQSYLRETFEAKGLGGKELEAQLGYVNEAIVVNRDQRIAARAASMAPVKPAAPAKPDRAGDAR